MWLLPGVDLPVPVEAAGISQHLAAVLALHARLPVGSDLPGPDAAEGGALPDLVPLLGSVGGCGPLQSAQTIEPAVALAGKRGEEV